MKPVWLLLLSVAAGVWSVPIDRNVGNQEVKEEVQEENGVTLSAVFSRSCVCLCLIVVNNFTALSCRTPACTTTGISER